RNQPAARPGAGGGPFHASPPGHWPKSISAIVPVASLNTQVFPLGRQDYFVISGLGVGRIRRVTQAVLTAQIFLDLAERFINGVLFGYFEESPARFLGEAFEDFLAVRS